LREILAALSGRADGKIELLNEARARVQKVDDEIFRINKKIREVEDAIALKRAQQKGT
jgi:hypothetical protein